MWTYTGVPADSTLDQVRLLIRDTTEATPLLRDEEINWYLSENTDVYSAAAAAARQISASYIQQARTKKVGDLALTYATNRAQEYESLACHLELRASRASAPVPYAGGISVSDKEANTDDDDIVDHAFGIGWTDDPAVAADVNFSRVIPG